MGKVIKDFVSDIDKKLAEFNQSRQPSASQQEEIDKYSRIHHMRDTPTTEAEESDDLWDF